MKHAVRGNRTRTKRPQYRLKINKMLKFGHQKSLKSAKSPNYVYHYYNYLLLSSLSLSLSLLLLFSNNMKIYPLSNHGNYFKKQANKFEKCFMQWHQITLPPYLYRLLGDGDLGGDL